MEKKIPYTGYFLLINFFMSIENQYSLLMKRNLIFFLLSFCSLIAKSQVINFVQKNSSSGPEKAINWTSSTFGNGFGHRWISADPGEFTTLNLQYRPNSSTWNEVMVITTLGNIDVDPNNPSNV